MKHKLHPSAQKLSDDIVTLLNNSDETFTSQYLIIFEILSDISSDRLHFNDCLHIGSFDDVPIAVKEKLIKIAENILRDDCILNRIMGYAV